MMNALIALGLGIVVFALIVGVGVIVLQNFGNATGGTANTTTNTLIGYLSGNLITWVPAIIALGVGLLFIGALMGRKGVKA
jgi:flagellar biosynthesis protein FliQ